MSIFKIFSIILSLHIDINKKRFILHTRRENSFSSVNKQKKVIIIKNLSREDIIEYMYFVKLCFRSEVKYQILAKNIEDLNHKVNVVALIIKENLEENYFASIYFEKEEN